MHTNNFSEFNFSKIFIIDKDISLTNELKIVFGSSIGLTVETYPNASTFLAALTPTSTGCIITEVHLPDMSGLELLDILNKRGDSLPVIFVTAYGDIDLAVRAMRAGAFDFISKPFDNELLITQTKKALATLPITRSKRRTKEHLSRLTQREKDILNILVNGKTAKEVAVQLGLSYRTVENYLASIKIKLGALSKSELIKKYQLHQKKLMQEVDK